MQETSEKRSFLVTGTAGFIGFHIANDLLKNKYIHKSDYVKK